ncbi:MAG: hypothetical protein Q9184_006607 [Pyrenodesmia sp. 2 TL-2023]
MAGHSRHSPKAGTASKRVPSILRPPQSGTSKKKPKSPTSRKKLAVTKTRKAATIALVNANSRNSRLLKLPIELRTKIFGYVLGDQLIHVEYNMSYAHESTWANGPLGNVHTQWSLAPGFSHMVCSADTTEHAAYLKSIYGYSEIPKEEYPDYYSEGCEKRHHRCFIMNEHEDHSARKLSLSLLGVSRQTYEEAHGILWTTNTFSFREPSVFNKFVAERNFVQRKKMAKLHLQITWPYLGALDWTRPSMERLMGNLPGLRNLDLCVEVSFIAQLARGLPTIASDPQLVRYLTTFAQFQQLPLKQARTIVAESEPFRKQPSGWNNRRFTWLEKRELACYIETRLLSDPSTTDVTEKVACKLEAERLEREAVK